MSSLDHLFHPSRGAAAAYQELVRGIMTSPPTPCSGRGEDWDCWDRDGYEIPTRQDAEEMCAGCPVLELCDRYAQLAKPAIGVYGGKVYGAGQVKLERTSLT